MILEYFPNNGFELNTHLFSWGEKRDSVRAKLKNQEREEDIKFETSEFFDGEISPNLELRRDIYENINNSKNYFFLNYDKKNSLNELEIHWGVKIQVKGIELEFGKDIDYYLKKFEAIGEEYIEIEEGNYLFKNLKFNISNSESSGGEGNGLDYFYASKNIDHLIEN